MKHENSSMNSETPGQTASRGECMDYPEITLGQAAYQINQVYTPISPQNSYRNGRPSGCQKILPWAEGAPRSYLFLQINQLKIDKRYIIFVGQKNSDNVSIREGLDECC